MINDVEEWHDDPEPQPGEVVLQLAGGDGCHGEVWGQQEHEEHPHWAGQAHLLTLIGSIKLEYWRWENIVN